MAPTTAAPARWRPGIEGQRRADLGDGTYLNPIVAGDHPDPTILKDGHVHYMTFTPFQACPGLVIWHFTDLFNWTPLTAALGQPLGNVFALDLCKHQGRYFIQIPARAEGGDWSIHVIWTDHIEGPWSDPIDLHIAGGIDPGHVVGEDGKRYLFVNGIRRVRLADEGLATDGALEHACTPWHYPADWVVEDFAPEGPKLLRHGGWFYLSSAGGGTAGPPTSHMLIAARSRSVHGPWENCPHNPLVRTQSVDEPWWSRGHASLVEGPAGQWWRVYRGYENGFRTRGRQTLLQPMERTADGWLRGAGGDLSRPLPKPRGIRHGRSGLALSADFSSHKFGVQRSLHDPGPDGLRRVRHEPGALHLAATGTSPADSTPLICIPGDRSCVAEAALDLVGHAEGGLLLFCSPKAFVGIGFSPRELKTFEHPEEPPWMRSPMLTSRVRIRLTNELNGITFHYSRDDGKSWILHGLRMEVPGLHHNVFWGGLA